ncbi:hypothetical protein AOLI_G00085180 [Acnodon oligacanthus]
MCPLRARSYSGHVARRVQQAEILQQIAVWERAGAPTLSGPQPESSPAAAACERLRSPLSGSAAWNGIRQTRGEAETRRTVTHSSTSAPHHITNRMRKNSSEEQLNSSLRRMEGGSSSLY